MRIARRFTSPDRSPYAAFEWVSRRSEIRNTDGSKVFEANDVKVPAHWSQVAIDILAQKYFRKAGVPLETVVIPEEGIPEWLCARKAAAGSRLDSTGMSNPIGPHAQGADALNTTFNANQTARLPTTPTTDAVIAANASARAAGVINGLSAPQAVARCAPLLPATEPVLQWLADELH